MRTRAGRRGAALAMLAGLAAASSPAWGQTLSEALVAAYEGNPRIAAGRAQLRAADERMNQAIAFSRPRVVLDGSLGYRGQSRARGSETWSTTLGIDQNVYGGGQSAALIRQRDNEILAGRARLANVEQEVLLQAATAYVDVVRARAVVELGCGAGLDARLLRERLGEGARLLAVDFAPQMLRRAREALSGVRGADARLLAGDLERLPLRSGFADLVLANASLNLAANKKKALGEARRVLRPGGRLLVRELVREEALPIEIACDPQAWNASLGGVCEQGEWESLLAEAGFAEVEISDHAPFPPVVSVRIRARKPRGEGG